MDSAKENTNPQPTSNGIPTTIAEKNQENSPAQSDSEDHLSKQVNQIQTLMKDIKVTEEDSSQPKKKDPNASSGKENRKSAQNQNEQFHETKYFIDISKSNIGFGKSTLFPGSIEEVDVAINLKEQIVDENASSNPLMLRVIAKCSNTEFDALDEYVFSVRSNERFEYFEQVRFKIRKKERALVKVAVKIPPVKESYNINGVLEIQLENLHPVCLPIAAKCEIPQIVCLKNLFKYSEECTMIKVPAKKNQIRMPPIPFKNLSNMALTLEVQTVSNQNFNNKPFDVMTQNFVNCQPNSQFFVNIQLKQNMNYKGVMPVKETIRKILLLKIKNSSVYFNFPLEVYVFESTNTGGMS